MHTFISEGTCDLKSPAPEGLGEPGCALEFAKVNAPVDAEAVDAGVDAPNNPPEAPAESTISSIIFRVRIDLLPNSPLFWKLSVHIDMVNILDSQKASWNTASMSWDISTEEW